MVAAAPRKWIFPSALGSYSRVQNGFFGSSSGPQRAHGHKDPYGMVWYGMVWYGMVWYGMVWYGMVWYGMVWYGMVWYGMVY